MAYNAAMDCVVSKELREHLLREEEMEREEQRNVFLLGEAIRRLSADDLLDLSAELYSYAKTTQPTVYNERYLKDKLKRLLIEQRNLENSSEEP